MAGKGTKLIANNKKAYHDYFIEDKYEAGIVLHGTEVKSLRMGKCSIKESFIHADHGEIYIERDYEASGTGFPERLYNHAAAGVFQGQPCESPDWPCSRKEAI